MLSGYEVTNYAQCIFLSLQPGFDQLLVYIHVLMSPKVALVQHCEIVEVRLMTRISLVWTPKGRLSGKLLEYFF